MRAQSNKATLERLKFIPCFFNGQNWIRMKAEINNESDRKQGNILFKPKKSDETVFVLEIYKNEQIDGNITEDFL